MMVNVKLLMPQLLDTPFACCTEELPYGRRAAVLLNKVLHGGGFPDGERETSFCWVLLDHALSNIHVVRLLSIFGLHAGSRKVRPVLRLSRLFDGVRVSAVEVSVVLAANGSGDGWSFRSCTVKRGVVAVGVLLRAPCHNGRRRRRCRPLGHEDRTCSPGRARDSASGQDR